MADRPRYPRSTCCIIGCASWSTTFPGEWMCRDHWMSLPAAWRRVLRRSWRRERAAYEREDCNPDKASHRAADRAYLAERRLWARAKRSATLTAAGL